MFLKSLSEGDAESALDTDEVIRYFVAHNFVLNYDSYTGSMLHNYYLYENNGKLSMLPWDYNLSFGGFGGAGMQGQNGSRSTDEATSLVNTGIDSVEKDPSAFYTVDEFKTAVSTLKSFCTLRAQSIRAQLNGTLSTTTSTQDASARVDASSLNIDSMGSQGKGKEDNKQK